MKHIQSLRNRAATSEIYLLLGVLPINAELHKRQLSLLRSIAMSQNNSMRETTWRQHTVGQPTSFFVRITDILDMYQLPSFIEIMNCHYNKIEWKNKVRTSISSYWSNKLRSDCEEKSTLNLFSTENLNIGKNHKVWDTTFCISNSVKDIRKAATKVRMLTGTYMLQTLKVKFNQAEVDPTCPICKLETEDLQHPSYKLSGIQKQ